MLGGPGGASSPLVEAPEAPHRRASAAAERIISKQAVGLRRSRSLFLGGLRPAARPRNQGAGLLRPITRPVVVRPAQSLGQHPIPAARLAAGGLAGTRAPPAQAPRDLLHV